MTRVQQARIAAEGVTMFGVLWALDAYFVDGTAFAGFNPNPYWIPVLAMALAYGSWPGMIAGAVASLCWLCAAHPPLALGEDPFHYRLALSVPPMLWMATSAALGEVTSGRLRRIGRFVARSHTQERNTATLVDNYQRLAAINRDLQVRIATDERSMGEALAIAVDLFDPHPARLAQTIAQLIATAAQTENFTLYQTTGYQATGGLWRSFVSGTDAHHPPPLPGGLIAAIEAGHDMLHVGDAAHRDLLGDIGVLAIPLRAAAGAPVLGMIVFHDLALAQMTRRKLIDFAEMARWLSLLLVRTGQLDRPVQPAQLRIVGSDIT